MRGRLVVVSLAALACAHHTVAPNCLNAGDPCSIREAKLDPAMWSCIVRREPAPPPSPTALEVETEPTPVVVEEGAAINFSVWMKNVTARPLDVDLTFACGGMEMSTYAEGSETPVIGTVEDGCSPTSAPVCGADTTARVTLAPRGELYKIMHFAAQIPRRASWGGACEDVMPRALAPGRYVARVQLPLAEEAPGPPGVRNHRHLDVPVIVTPFKETLPKLGAP